MGRGRRPSPTAVRWCLFAVLLLLWEFVPQTELIPELFLPALSKTLAVLYEDRAIYFSAMLVTLSEIGLAMLISCGLGTLVGALVGGLASLRELFLPVFSTMYAVPIVILYPIMTAWLGVGSESKIVFAGVYAFFPVMLSTAAGIRSIEPQFVVAARSMGATTPQLITRVILPASLPTVFLALRFGGALTIIGVVVSEMLTSAAGIGYVVTLNRTILDSPRVWAAILLILIMAIGYYMLAQAIERRMVVWQSAGRESATSSRPRRSGASAMQAG